MQQIKQVEVRMDESHLEGRGDPPESTCSMVCDKIMKNMVLTLTILGKCFWHWVVLSPLIFLLILVSATGGGRSYCSWSCYRRADKRDHARGRLTLTACFWGNGKHFQTPSCEQKHTNAHKWIRTKLFLWMLK